MSLVKFEIFHTVASMGSLTKAGEKLNLTQSAVSHAISGLEKDLGFSLLTRNRSGLKVTSDGERILQYIREILRLHEIMLQEAASIKGLEIGTVKIGTFTSVSTRWLPEIIKQFQKNYPGITLELYDGNYTKIEQWLTEGEIDCGFVNHVKSNSFDIVPLKKDRLLCIVSEQNILSAQERISFKQIEAEPFIMPRYGNEHDVKRIFREHKVKPNIKLELTDDRTIMAMVQHNFGISIMPEMILENLPENVKTIALEKDCFRSIGIATTYQMSPATKKFIDTVKNWLGE
ncbi:LysR family transcriptional regulator [Bacillaceae bacterium Marseille-Q3522]|nr:LysR family transcriptional regulator [Bacillaceae bacterium Marseille-Q3522]